MYVYKVDYKSKKSKFVDILVSIIYIFFLGKKEEIINKHSKFWKFYKFKNQCF